MHTLWLQGNVVAVAAAAQVIMPSLLVVSEARTAHWHEGTMFCLVNGIHARLWGLLLVKGEPPVLLRVVVVGIAGIRPLLALLLACRSLRQGDWNEFPNQRTHGGQASTDECRGYLQCVGEVRAVNVGPRKVIVVDVGKGDQSEDSS